jgi:hypothetical protein
MERDSVLQKGSNDIQWVNPMGHQADSIDISQWGTKGSQVKIPMEFRYFSIFVGLFCWPGHFRPARIDWLGFSAVLDDRRGVIGGLRVA